jgi:glycosyltransferase involved in cell wall biosynthesis
MTAPRVRLYGPSQGEHSFVQVTRGMRRALSAAGELAGVYSFDTDDEGLIDGLGAPVSLNCGSPGGLPVAHRVGGHTSHWLLLAPNGEALPRGLIDSLLEPSKVLPGGLLTGGLLTPSAWAAGVLRRLVPGKPVIVAPHGLTPDVHRVDPAARDNTRREYRHGMFSVLHMTSSETERKGTHLLLRAWAEAKRKGSLPPLARLFVVMNPLHLNRVRWWCADLKLADTDVTVIPGLAYGQDGVASMYSTMHLICQPSRGEGFGCVPLESLACGVPIAATACTGHSEFLGMNPPGFVQVQHGDVAPMDDFPGSTAPSVSVAAIEDALAEAHARWDSLAERAEQNADALRVEWTWEKKNVAAIRRMLQEANNVRPE